MMFRSVPQFTSTIYVVRSKSGQSFTELATGLLVVIPIVLLCIDVATICMGVTLNDSVCRDAARAASLGAPNGITPGEPQRRAEGVVNKANKTTGAIRLDPAVTVTENIVSLPLTNFGGPVKGEVTVFTTVHVFPPFLLSTFVGAMDKGIDFKTSQTFSYTWAKASTATMEAPPAGNGTGKTF